MNSMFLNKKYMYINSMIYSLATKLYLAFAQSRGAVQIIS